MKTFILSLLLSSILSGQSDTVSYQLIAHRGGVVGSTFTENSAQAIKEAADEGYWMVEIDIRQTKDGQAVVQHDATFERYYQDKRKVEDMDMSQIKQLRSNQDGASPLTLDEMLALCQAYGLKIMVDTKAPHSESFLTQIEFSLAKYNLLKSAYIIGTPESRKFFKDEAKVGAPRTVIQDALANREDVNQNYFLFEHGNELNKETVSWAQKNKVTVVPSVNKFHYEDQENMMKEAKADIIWLKECGVTQFQIDSEFDDWF